MDPSLPANGGKETELLSPGKATGDTSVLRKVLWRGGRGIGEESTFTCKAVEDVELFVFCGRRFRGVEVDQIRAAINSPNLRPWEDGKCLL